MREIKADIITQTVAQLCAEANVNLPKDVSDAIKNARKNEKWPEARDTFDKLIENMELAKNNRMAICQDTGMACVFLELGQDLHVDGDIVSAINAGVRKGYTEGYLRSSVVADPLRRKNTNDNTPALIHIDIVPGDKLKIIVAPKGFGSENMSRLAMLKPSDGEEGVIDFIVETVKIAGPNPCPPIILGVGIGGSFDRVALLAKKALLKPLDVAHEDPYYAELEERLLRKINDLGIGAQGFGGSITALSVKIESYPTHIAGLPVAVNVCCHVARHAEQII